MAFCILSSEVYNWCA